MARTTREKIALIVLALLIVLISVCACAYMSTAKSWTLAASYVDDTVGSMEGYTVIAYAGTLTPQDDFAESAESAEGVGVDSAGFDGEAEGLNLEHEEGVLEGEGPSAPESESALESDVHTVLDEDGILPPLKDMMEEEKAPLYVSDVRDDYEEKGAFVLSLDTRNLERYLEPSLLMVNGKRVGVFSVDVPVTQTYLDVYLGYFEKRDVDVVVCLTTGTSNLPSLEGIDVVLVTTPQEGLSTIGIERDDAFVLRTPEVGSVGVILITSNNVVSSKVVDAL